MLNSNKAIFKGLLYPSLLAVAIVGLGGIFNGSSAQSQVDRAENGSRVEPEHYVGERAIGPVNAAEYREYSSQAPQIYSMPRKPTSGVDAPYTHMIRDNYSGDSRLDAPYVRMHADPYGGKSLSTPWIHIDNWGGGLHLRSPFFRKDIN